MKRLPISLQVLAVLFILVGLVAVARTITDWAYPHRAMPHVRVDVVNVLVGLGLLRRRNWCRILALVWLWLGVVGIGLYLTWFTFAASHPYYSGPVPGWYPNPDLVFEACLAGFGALCLWGIGVLNKPHVKECFPSSTSTNLGHPPDGPAATLRGNPDASAGRPPQG